jgi:hypothetical protein
MSERSERINETQQARSFIEPATVVWEAARMSERSERIRWARQARSFIGPATVVWEAAR